jgi:hypothetical protein
MYSGGKTPNLLPPLQGRRGMDLSTVKIQVASSETLEPSSRLHSITFQKTIFIWLKSVLYIAIYFIKETIDIAV